MAVGSRCIHVAPNAGAVISQAASNPRLGHLGLGLLRQGYPAPRVLDEMAASDAFVERRQLGCVDVHGLSAARTGAANRPWAGHRAARDVVAAANAVVGPGVVDAMFEPWEREAALPLWEASGSIVSAIIVSIAPTATPSIIAKVVNGICLKKTAPR